ncbi:hypothetical protein T484DRAFT_1764590 [Baffinella frigidus]|nr:hypothetical protein T484DRAFT_1764590 [Cryptophyta sp. CCMP2293]
MWKAWRGTWKTKAPRNEANSASTAQPLEEEKMRVPSIASRRRRPVPPALNLQSLQQKQPAAIEKTIEKPSTLSIKRSSIKERIRLPPIFSKPSAKIPESVHWLDNLGLPGFDEDRQSLADDILRFFEHKQQEACEAGRSRLGGG